MTSNLNNCCIFWLDVQRNVKQDVIEQFGFFDSIREILHTLHSNMLENYLKDSFIATK